MTNIIKFKGQATQEQVYMDSREVAEITGKRHDHLLRDIERYAEVISQNPILGTDDYFVESTYLSGTGKPYKHYLLTKKGCEMVANKMTGDKGIMFTAVYVDRFNQMEHTLVAKQDSYMIEDPVERAKRWIEEQEEKKELELVTKVQEQQILELTPKVSYYDNILNSKSLINVSVIAKDYGIATATFNKMLNEYGIQYKHGKTWLLYAKYQAEGYTQSKTYPYFDTMGIQRHSTSTKWTQKGRLFLYNFLKEKGILPLVEQGKNEIA